MTPSFKYVRDPELWPGDIFSPLLLRHGPPPPGIKYAGKVGERYYMNGTDARRWHDNIAADCKAAVEAATILSHYKKNWRNSHALNIKNRFIRWCLDGREN